MEFSIGELARRAGVKVPTIRYYETVGILPPPPRTDGRQRRYDDRHLKRLKFVRHARDLGFDIEDIREMLRMSEKPDQSCSDVDEIARRHLAAVDRRIRQLGILRTELQHMVDECSHGRVGECRVIETLADDTHEHERL